MVTRWDAYELDQRPDGKWVRHSDYAALERKVERLRDALVDLHAVPCVHDPITQPQSDCPMCKALQETGKETE